MFKQVLFEQEARTKILEGVDIVAKAVSSTLGPRGQNVIFEETIHPTVTKDGVTVAQQILLEDKFQNMGVMLAREAAENTNREAGDGTTTTIVLLNEIVKEGNKAVASGMNPILLKRGMDLALDMVIKSLDEQTKKIKTDKEKEQTAIISANNDEKTGKMIADVLKRVGTDGVVTVSNSNSLKTEVEYVKGIKLDSGFLTAHFVNDPKRLGIRHNNPKIIITTDEIKLQAQLIEIVEMMLAENENTFILFAEKIEGQAMGFIVQNFLKGNFTCIPIKLPSFAGYQRDLVYDLASLTNATVLGKDEAKELNEAEIEDIGKCEHIFINRDSTIISGTEGNAKERIKEAKALLKEEEDLFNKEKLKERIGRMTGSIADIKIGGATESEQEEVKYRVEDALNATKHAIKEGIVEGGGIALLKAGAGSFVSEGRLREYDEGMKIVFNALTSPLKKIADNGGISGEAVVGRCLDRNQGYNALTSKYGDLIEDGVIDPVKVVKNEIINAVSTAGVLLTCGCAITIKKDE